MRRLLPCIFLACALTPALASAAPPHRAGLRARPAKHAASKARKPAVVLAATERRVTPKRPDVCALVQHETKSVTLQTHRIERGDSLSVIAWRYGTSVKALAAANGLTPEQKIRTGQKLVIPQHSRPGGGDEWLKYATPAKERGRLDLVTLNQSRFRGQVVEDGRLLPSAREGISSLVGAKGTHPPLAERLLRLLVRVSDTFGGRQLRVVSGYRSSSYFSDSRHKSSEAIDFSIPGIPNAVLRQYLLLLDDVGVGYYPNSSFLHLDVRGCPMQWVDYAGPGEAPRRSPRQPARAMMASKERVPSLPSDTESPRASDQDDIAEEVAAAMAEAPAPAAEADVEAQAPKPTRTDATQGSVASSASPRPRR